MTESLGEAMDAAVAAAKADDTVLQVAPLATELSLRFDYNARSIARQIIERGILAGISIEMRMPDDDEAA